MKWYWEDLTGGVEEVVWSRKKGGWWAMVLYFDGGWGFESGLR
jgi:hypothetical protein